MALIKHKFIWGEEWVEKDEICKCKKYKKLKATGTCIKCEPTRSPIIKPTKKSNSKKK